MSEQHLYPRPEETPKQVAAPTQWDSTKSDEFAAMFGRVIRDIHRPDMDLVTAMYKACEYGWRAGYDYGQQS